MNNKLNVSVDENKRWMTLQVGIGGLYRIIEIDLTDTKSIVDGVVAASSANDQLIQAQIAALTKRVESLEALSKESLAL